MGLRDDEAEAALAPTVASGRPAPADDATRSLDARPPASRPPPDDGAAVPLPEGDRYVLLDRVGEGGMAVVYAAFDKALNRKVALKVLKAEASADADARMRREAQALARLRHPNVVAVYDVGKLEGGRIFVAMEFIEAGSLRQWLAREARPRRAVVAMLLQAGEGLSAAHAAGLVHRDFKPDNVLVGDDEVARVADFGLARAVEIELPSEVPAPEAAATQETLTRAGTIMGTPRYMAPEQLRGERADARADQFAFGVTLYESLHRAAPFDGTTIGALLAQIERGPKPPPKKSDVPPWLQAVARRAMQADPSQRFPSMRELLAALSADPTRTRRRVYAFAATALVVGAGALVTAKVKERERMACKSAPPITAAAWNDAVRGKVKDAFEATGLPRRAEMYEATIAALDARAAAIESGRVDACEATHLRHVQTRDVEGLRMTCLERRRDELAEMGQLLAGGGDTLLTHAAHATRSLPPVDECNDVHALEGPIAPPTDPQDRARVDALGPRLARLYVLTHGSSDTQGTLAFAEETAAMAREAGYTPLEAEAMLDLGYAREDAGDFPGTEAALREAYALADRGRHDVLRARAAFALAIDVGRVQGRFVEGHLWGNVALDAAARVGDPALEAGAEYAVGLVYKREGAFDEARVHHHRALDAYERSHTQQQSSVWMSLGDIDLDLGRFEEARTSYERGIALVQARVSPWDSAFDQASVAGLELVLEQYARAKETLERALDEAHTLTEADNPRITLFEGTLARAEAGLDALGDALAHAHHDATTQAAAHGDDDVTTAEARLAEGEVLRRMGRLDEARAVLGRASATLEAAVPKGHTLRTLAVAELGDLALDEGKLDEAEARATEALAAMEAAFGPEHYEIAGVLTARCAARLERGNGPGAVEDATRALVVAERSFGASHAVTARARACLGESRLAAGDDAGARDALERALNDWEAAEEGPSLGAPLRFALARALEKSDRARAATLAARAEADLAKTGSSPRLRARIADWLRAHHT